MIRVAILDDHPALRAGLEAVLRSEPGIVPVGAVGSTYELWPMLRRSTPDIVLLDYHLPGEDGLAVCQRIKDELVAPRVVLYTAYASSALAIPAIVAGADAILSKGVPARELFETLRRVSAGERVLPPIGPEHLNAAGQAVGPDNVLVLGMLVNRLSLPDIAGALGLEIPEIRRRRGQIIDRLGVEVPEHP